MTGWVCPKCERVYGPHVAECWTCNAARAFVPASTGTVTVRATTCAHCGGVVWENVIHECSWWAQPVNVPTVFYQS